MRVKVRWFRVRGKHVNAAGDIPKTTTGTRLSHPRISGLAFQGGDRAGIGFRVAVAVFKAVGTAATAFSMVAYT